MTKETLHKAYQIEDKIREYNTILNLIENDKSDPSYRLQRLLGMMTMSWVKDETVSSLASSTETAVLGLIDLIKKSVTGQCEKLAKELEDL